MRINWSKWQYGLQMGALLGGVLIFLTLIGLPSQDSEELAAGIVPLYGLIAFGFGWWVARQSPPVISGQNVLLTGIIGLLLFLFFMGQINRLQASGVDVSGQYFARMTPYTMSTLSGIPEDELIENPPVDPITQTIPADEVQRTNPMSLRTSENYALVALGGAHLGGLYGLAVILVLAAVLGGFVQELWSRVNWTQVHQTWDNPTFAEARHWLTLVLPVLLFAIFWLTVDQSFRGGLFGDGNPARQIIQLDRVFNLSSTSLVNEATIQLGLVFAIIISAIVASRQARHTPTSLPYQVRLAYGVILIAVFFAFAVWRITLSGDAFIVPSFADQDPAAWSVGAMFLVAVIMLIYYFTSVRYPENFETAFTNVLIAGAILLTPLYLNEYQSFVFTNVAIWTMFGLGLNIVVGYAGLLDLGYIAFFAIGAYTFALVTPENTRARIDLAQLNHVGWTIFSAILLIPAFMLGASYLLRSSQREQRMLGRVKQRAPLWDQAPAWYFSPILIVIAIVITLAFRDFFTGKEPFHVWEFSPFIVAAAAAMICCAFGGIMLGIPVLRLRGDYLAIVTLGFGEIISLSLRNLESVTGGPSGALGIPKPVPDGTPALTTNLALLYLALVGAGLIVVVSTRFRGSRLGRAWLAMRSDEDIAQAMGIDLVNTKLLAFSIGASFAGLAGMVFASQLSNAFPESFTLDQSINVLALVIIGGTGSLPGIIVGSIVLIGLPELLRPIADYRIMAFGLLLVVTMVLRPAGLMPSPPPALEAEARRLAEEEDRKKAALK